MYPASLVARNFNYQSFNHQPRINLKQINEIIRNQNEVKQANVEVSTSISNQQLNEKKLISSSSNDNHKTKNASKSSKTDQFSKKHPENSLTTHLANQDRLLSRQSSVENISTKYSTPLLNSRLLSTLYDRIQKERKAHTMAPLARILGPSSSPQARMFASIIAPTDVQADKSNNLTQGTSKTTFVSYPKSDIEMTDDDAPIIVKVRYNPEAGTLPSEDAIRQAVDNQLNQRSDKKSKKEPIIVNFLGKNIQPQLPIRPQQPVFNQSKLPIQQHPSLQTLIPSQQKQQTYQRNPPLPQIAPKPSRTSSSIPPVHRPPLPFLQNGNIHPVQAPKPLIKRKQLQSIKIPQLPNRNISSGRTNRTSSTGFGKFKQTNIEMATQQPPTTINKQQNLSKRPHTSPSSTEIFRPPAIKDIPELSKENLLNMLNQIPDLQGRRFNIEYAPPSAPEGYPIPLNLDPTNNTYPEPVVIDKLPNNVIQHVQSSNNPAIKAALEATIREEQHVQSQSTVSTLNIQPPTVMHHAAQPYQHVQQSRPVSSNDSDSSTEVSSFETSSSSSSEETDSEELENVSSAMPANNIPFVGPVPSTSYFQNQYR